MFIPSQNWGEDIAINSSLVKKNLDLIKQNIAHCNVKIIAVTKYYGRQSIISGYEAGLRDFAESRAIESIEKINSLPEDIKQNSIFHFIGHLQTNKAEKVVKNFDIIHSVDSFKLAKVISDSACRLNKKERILLQINNAGEEQKSGFAKDELKSVFESIIELSGIEVIGLMNMAPLGASEQELNKLFGDIKDFKNELESSYKVKLPELSMGMSDDYEVAVKNGATMIRIGRKLFT